MLGKSAEAMRVTTLDHMSPEQLKAELAVEPIAMIVGMARSGTTWLSLSLMQHRDVVVLGETSFWGRQFRDWPAGRVVEGQALVSELEELIDSCLGIQRAHGGGNVDLREQAVAVARRASSEGAKAGRPADVFLIAGNCIRLAAGKIAWVEKTPHHLLWYDRIGRELPATKFLVCVRNPLEAMNSYKHQPQAPRGLYHPFGYSVTWRASFRTTEQLRRRWPHRALLVPYAAVASDPQQMFERVLEFLRLDKDAEAASKVNSSFSDGRSMELEAAEVLWMKLINWRQTDAPLNISVKSLMSFAVSLVMLPIWFVRVVRIRAGDSHTSLRRYFMRWLRRGLF